MGRRVELRGPCNELFGELVGAVLVFKCGRCTRRSGRPIYHLFGSEQGRPVAQMPPATRKTGER